MSELSETFNRVMLNPENEFRQLDMRGGTSNRAMSTGRILHEMQEYGFPYTDTLYLLNKGLTKGNLVIVKASDLGLPTDDPIRIWMKRVFV